MRTKGVRRLLVCALSVCLVSLGQFALGESPEDRLYQKGVELYRRGEVSEALSLFQRVRESKPDHHAALYAVGLSLFGLERYDEARRALMQVLLRDPSDYRAMLILARIDLALGEITRARRRLVRVMERYPKDVSTLIGMAQAERMAGNRFAAEEYLKKALAVEPDNEKLQTVVARAERANREYLAAKDAMERRRVLMAFNRLVAEASRQWTAAHGGQTQTTTGVLPPERSTRTRMGSGMLIPFPTVSASGTQVQLVPW